MRRLACLGALLFALLPVAALAGGGGHPVPVTECGQLVPAGRTGVLMHDLVCGRVPVWPFSPTGVILDGEATLELNGFSITGTADKSGVGVGGFEQNGGHRLRYRVRGPGEITGFWAALNAGGHRFVATDVTLRGNGNGMELRKGGAVTLRNVVASDNDEYGVLATRLRAIDVDASRNGIGGISSGRARLKRVTAEGNGVGGGIRLGGLRRTGGGRLVDSVITGNDGMGEGFDVLAYGPLRIRRTECDSVAVLRRVRPGGTNVIDLLRTLACPGR